MSSSSTLSILLAVGLAACGGPAATTAPQAPVATATAPTSDDPSCPVVVPGTSVTTEDTNTGGALVFVTTGDAGEIRKRVATLAAMHNEHHGAMGPLPTGDEPAGDHAGHGGHDHANHAGHAGGGTAAGQATGPRAMGMMIGVHSKASSEDIEGGARIVFVVGASDVAKLQGELRMHAQHLGTGTCAMDHE